MSVYQQTINIKQTHVPENIQRIRKYFGHGLKKSDNKSLLKRSISQRFERNLISTVLMRKLYMNYNEDSLFDDFLSEIINNQNTGWKNQEDVQEEISEIFI
jgi:hypothetical protein